MLEADDLTTFMCRMSGKFGSLKLLEPSGPHRDCYGTPLPFFLFKMSSEISAKEIRSNIFKDYSYESNPLRMKYSRWEYNIRNETVSIRIIERILRTILSRLDRNLCRATLSLQYSNPPSAPHHLLLVRLEWNSECFVSFLVYIMSTPTPTYTTHFHYF